MRIFALDLNPSILAPPQPHAWAHLVAIRAGVAIVHCATARTYLTPATAAWLPAGIPYSLEVRTRCELRILYIDSEAHRSRAFGPVLMTALLHELAQRATVRGYFDPSNPRDARLIAVIHDEIANLHPAMAATSLMMPQDASLRAALDGVLGQPDGFPKIPSIAEAAGVPVRTFERRFARQTGLTPREWLRRARLNAAMLALASGASVTETGFACGYASTSAFVAAYRDVFGITPGRTRMRDREARHLRLP